MTLIQSEHDDAAILRAEDEAIRALEAPPPPAAPEDIAALIERLTNGDDAQVPTEDRQG